MLAGELQKAGGSPGDSSMRAMRSGKGEVRAGGIRGLATGRRTEVGPGGAGRGLLFPPEVKPNAGGRGRGSSEL